MTKAKTSQAPAPKVQPGPALGYKIPNFFRGSKFGGKANYAGPKFNASQFRTQHKGGS
jgi:hypothetical protein